jgi:hypothetical protein
MAVALHSFKMDDDGQIRVRHTFYADTEEEADALLEAHAEVCPKFGPAVRGDRTVQVVEEIENLPTPDTVDDFANDALAAFDEDDEKDDDDED